MSSGGWTGYTGWVNGSTAMEAAFALARTLCDYFPGPLRAQHAVVQSLIYSIAKNAKDACIPYHVRCFRVVGGAAFHAILCGFMIESETMGVELPPISCGP